MLRFFDKNLFSWIPALAVVLAYFIPLLTKKKPHTLFSSSTFLPLSIAKSSEVLKDISILNAEKVKY